MMGCKGYNQPVGLERLDPFPIFDYEMNDKMMTEVPGFQKVRPSPEETVRGVAGHVLHFGRLISFSHLLFYFTFCSASKEKQVYEEVEEEWLRLKELTSTDD